MQSWPAGSGGVGVAAGEAEAEGDAKLEAEGEGGGRRELALESLVAACPPENSILGVAQAPQLQGEADNRIPFKLRT